MNANETNRPYSLTPGWICLVFAVLLTAILGPLGLIIGGPLMLICVILSIIGMAKENTGGGIALLLSSLFLVPGAFVAWMALVAVGLTLAPSDADTSIEMNSVPLEMHSNPDEIDSVPIEEISIMVAPQPEDLSDDGSGDAPMFGASAGSIKKGESPEAESVESSETAETDPGSEDR